MTPSKNLKLIRKGLKDKHAALALKHAESLPNFIIIGAAKSATTTLTTILPKHPDIFISKPKEPKFLGVTTTKDGTGMPAAFQKVRVRLYGVKEARCTQAK